jgi:hypothetical protein
MEYAYGDKLLRFYARTPQRAALAHALAPGAGPQHKTTAAITPDLRLAGYDQAVQDFRSGDTVHLFLYWQYGDQTIEGSWPSEAEVRLVDSAGQTWQGEPILPPQGSAPALAGLARQQVDFLVSPDTPSGRYTFYLFNGQGASARLGGLWLRQRQQTRLTPADVTIPHRLEADFASGIRLLGYAVETESPQPGDALRLTLYWQAQAALEKRYKVFTHLLGDVYNAESNNFLWGQQDNEPVSNTRPTPTWGRGEVIVDSYAIPISASAPAGAYRLEIGLYDPVTGERLMVMDEEGTAVADHLILATITIIGE